VISVGAVHRFDYEDPSGTTGIIEDYSSRGPTNSNNQSPDISAPTNTTTVAYSGNFGGTSCATPNAAGMAAAFWSAHSELNAQGVRRILFAKADIYKDWGTNGTDYIYGRGGVFLHDYHSRNRYVLSNAGNTTSSPTLPYYSMKDIDDDAPVANDRYIYYLQTSDSNTAPSIMTKPMLYRSVTETGTIIK
jgi:hypothetical protein